MASQKYLDRQQLAIADSAAIGDFYTCVLLLDEPVRTELRREVRAYVQTRLAASLHPPSDDSAFQHLLADVDGSHGRMLDLVRQGMAAKPALTTSLAQTYNEVTTAHSVRVAAVRSRLPPAIVVLLLVSAVLPMAITGRILAAEGRAHGAVVLLFVAVVALVIAITLDLSQPARGLIRLDHEAMQRLLDGMEK